MPAVVPRLKSIARGDEEVEHLMRVDAVCHHLQQQRFVQILRGTTGIQSRGVTGIALRTELAIQVLGREGEAQAAGVGAVVAAVAVQNDS